MKAINTIRMGGVDVLPLVEGGKGVAVSNGRTCGAWASAGGVGTFSAVNADSYDADGSIIRQIYHGKTRRDRHEELVEYGIKGGIAQAQRAWDLAGGKGRIHANILWEMGGAERVARGMLEGARGLIHGVTCGAGMPYKLAEVARDYGIHYYPIISSARAFAALWKRAYHKTREWLGGVVYEDPWLAGGHNGLSNSEDPKIPEAPFPRVLKLRQQMREFGLDDVPIIMAGGVWWLDECCSPSHPPGFILPPCAMISCANWKTAMIAKSPIRRKRWAIICPNMALARASAPSMSRRMIWRASPIGKQKASRRPCARRTIR